MVGLGERQPNWRDRLWAELRRDKKKASLLGGLLLAAAVLGVRMLVQAAGSSPVVATAGVAAPQGTAMPGPTPAGSPSVAAVASADAARSGSFGGADVRSLRSRPKLAQDIFAAKLHLFPPEDPPKPAPASEPASQPVDQEAVLKAAILAKAKGLSLQSTVISGESKAIINGQLVGIGDAIEGFKVVKVTAHACVLVLDGVQVRLEMKDS